MRKSQANIDQAAVNAELRKQFGSTATRAQLLDYRSKTGIDPKWIRRNAACRIGRGVYEIPDGTTPDVPVRREAKRDKVPAGERAVLPTPFDDDTYDGDAAPVEDAPKRRGRKHKEEGPSLIDAPDYEPAIQERAAPQFIHAWVCKGEGCPGRKPGSFYGPDNSAPICECGAEMARHAWTKKRVW